MLRYYPFIHLKLFEVIYYKATYKGDVHDYRFVADLVNGECYPPEVGDHGGGCGSYVYVY